MPWVRSSGSERSREMTREPSQARESGKKDQALARNRLGKFLGYDRKPAVKMKSWGAKYMAWLDGVRFDELGSHPKHQGRL